MPDSPFKQDVQKGTVYSGPASQTKGTVYNGPAPATQGTVYNGPSIQTKGGTVYNGPSPAGTVYNGPAPSIAAPQYGTRPGTTAVNVGAVKGAKIFYTIAGFTAINTVLMFIGIRFAIGVGNFRLSGATLGTIILVNVVGAGLFVLLGVFTQGGSKIAFLTGMLLYAGDLVLLLMNDAGLHIISIVIHGLFLFYLFSAFREFAD
jgi:hypothetical protein